MRYRSTRHEGLCSLEDYVKSMKEGQKKIYYIVSQDIQEANRNPFMEPFKHSNVPVLLVGDPIQEVVFNQIGTYKGFTFVSVESGFEEIAKDVGDKDHTEMGGSSIPDEDVTQFCLWIKEEMQPFVGKVTISRRLKSVPIVLFG